MLHIQLNTIRFISSNRWYISFSVFTIAFVLSKIPFLLVPAVVIYPDSFEYHQAADYLRNFHFSKLSSLPIDLPLGYPLFCVILKGLGFNNIGIVIIQCILRYLSFLFLIRVIDKIFKNLFSSIFAAVSLGIFVNDTRLQTFDYGILTESLFISFIAFTIAFYILSIYKTSKFNIILLSFFLFGVALIRSNGICLYFLFFFLFFFLLKSKKRKLFLLVLSIFIGGNLIWATFNYSVGFYFLPGNFSRFLTLVEPSQTKKIKQTETKEIIPPSLYHYLFNNQRRAFDYTRYIQFAIAYNHSFNNKNSAVLLESFAKHEKIRKYCMSESYNDSIPLDKYANYVNVLYENNGSINPYGNYVIQPKGYFAASILFYIYILKSIYASTIWMYMLFSIFTLAVIQFVRNKFKDVNSFLIISLGLIYILYVFSIAFLVENYVNHRFEFVVAFIVYLFPAFLPLLFDSKFNFDLQIKFKTPKLIE